MRRISPRLPTVAALTMVRDETRMLPKWIDHYAAQLGVEHLVVIDDHSTDGSTEGLPCRVVRTPEVLDEPFEVMRMTQASRLAAELLETHDAVLFCDADEMLVADPARHASLRHLVAARGTQDVIGAQGINVLHHVGAEPVLDLSRPVLEQRRLAMLIPLMCKPAIKRVPLRWRAASHGIGTPWSPDPDLFMFHLKFADVDALRATGEHRRALVEMDGRAKQTTWAAGGDQLVDLVTEITAGVGPVEEIAEFRANPDWLADLVKGSDAGVYRAGGRRQIAAMRARPLVRIPDRFAGTT